VAPGGLDEESLAFLRPAGHADEERPTRLKWTPDGIDMLVASKTRDVKLDAIAEAESDDWLRALATTQTCAGYIGPGHYGVSRMNKGLASRNCVGLRPAKGGREAWLDERRLREEWRGNRPGATPALGNLVDRALGTGRPSGAAERHGVVGDHRLPCGSDGSRSLTMGERTFSYEGLWPGARPESACTERCGSERRRDAGESSAGALEAKLRRAKEAVQWTPRTRTIGEPKRGSQPTKPTESDAQIMAPLAAKGHDRGVLDAVEETLLIAVYGENAAARGNGTSP